MQELAFRLKKLQLRPVPYAYPAWSLVGLWESGAMPPDSNTLMGLCRVLECTPGDLLTELPDPPPLPEPEPQQPPLFAKTVEPSGVQLEVRAFGRPDGGRA